MRQRIAILDTGYELLVTRDCLNKDVFRLFLEQNKEDNRPRKIRGRDKKEKAPLAVFRQAGRESSGDLLSRARGPGTIGDLRLNFRVRDGNGCDPHSITAETISLTWKLNQASVLKRSGFGLLTQ